MHTVASDIGKFAIVPDWITKAGFSANAVLTYIALAMYANSVSECWPSHESMAESVSLSVMSIRRGLKELADGGVVVIEPRVENGKQVSNTYRIVHPRKNDGCSIRTSCSTLNNELDQVLSTPLRSVERYKKARVREKFVPPGMEECERYARQKMAKGQGELFWMYWDERGWARRSGPMRSWTKSLDLWIRQNQQRQPQRNLQPQRNSQSNVRASNSNTPPQRKEPLSEAKCMIPVEEWD